MPNGDFGDPSLGDNRNEHGANQICRRAFPRFLGLRVGAIRQRPTERPTKICGGVSPTQTSTSVNSKSFSAADADAVQAHNRGKAAENEKNQRRGTYGKGRRAILPPAGVQIKLFRWRRRQTRSRSTRLKTLPQLRARELNADRRRVRGFVRWTRAIA